MNFTKIVRPGTVPGRGTMRVNVFCKITYLDGRLAISGVIGPYASGNAYGSCGQIDMGFAHRNKANDDARYSALYTIDDMRFAPDWDPDTWLDFLDVWKRWHMNDMNSTCEHQRAAGWTYDTHIDRPKCPRCGRPLERRTGETQDPGIALDGDNSYLACPACFYDAGGTIKPPPGFPYAGLPCPECGYRIGSAWLFEPVPLHVLDFLRALPDADREPAWV